MPLAIQQQLHSLVTSDGAVAEHVISETGFVSTVGATVPLVVLADGIDRTPTGSFHVRRQGLGGGVAVDEAVLNGLALRLKSNGQTLEAFKRDINLGEAVGCVLEFVGVGERHAKSEAGSLNLVFHLTAVPDAEFLLRVLQSEVQRVLADDPNGGDSSSDGVLTVVAVGEQKEEVNGVVALHHDLRRDFGKKPDVSTGLETTRRLVMGTAAGVKRVKRIARLGKDGVSEIKRLHVLKRRPHLANMRGEHGLVTIPNDSVGVRDVDGLADGVLERQGTLGDGPVKLCGLDRIGAVQVVLDPGTKAVPWSGLTVEHGLNVGAHLLFLSCLGTDPTAPEGAEESTTKLRRRTFHAR